MPPPTAARVLARAGEKCYQVIIADHLIWARAIARGIRRAYRFQTGSQEERDLEAVAYLTLVRLVATFDVHRVPAGGDPAGQFRGWSHPYIRGEVNREAIRLRNGGSYWTRAEKGRAPVRVRELPTRQTETGAEEVVLADHRVAPEPEPTEVWAPVCAEPDEDRPRPARAGESYRRRFGRAVVGTDPPPVFGFREG